MSRADRPGRIAVLRPGALGDAVLTLPVLQSLAAGAPGAHVVAIGSPAFRLAVDCGCAAEAVPFDDTRLLGLFAEGGKCGLLANCDLCIAYGRRPDPVLSASLRRSGVVSVVEWPSHPAPGLHVVDHLLGAVESVGFAAAGRRPTLPPQAAWTEAGRDWLAARGVRGDFIAVHPGSGGRSKRWPAECFGDLALRAECPAIWLLGPAEADDEELHAVGERVGIVADGLPLPAVAGLLAACRAYVGNDSGASHLAAAVGAPTVALFGPTDPAVWAPRGERIFVVRGAAGLDGLAVDEVAAALARAMAPREA